MFKQSLLVLSGLLVGYIGGMGALSHADGLYVGAAVGVSKAKFPDSTWECANCLRQQIDTQGSVAEVFAGYQSGRLGLEVGAGSLSRYRSHNIRSTSDIQQEIDTAMVYVRGLAYTNEVYRLRGFVSLGMARVSMRNHEFGRNDPTMQYVDQLNYDVRTRPLYGIGAEYRANSKVSIRVEATRITDVAVSHWTLHQDVSSVWLGLVAHL